jgi:GTP 3',8-cyclase
LEESAMTVTLEHVETNITIACNNACVGCNHFVPLQQPKGSFMTPEQLAHDLEHFGKVAHIRKYAFIGGEPTLHPKLLELVEVARRSEIADRIEIWTNGQTLRNKMGDWPHFWSAFDSIIVSAYPGKLSDDDIIWTDSKCQESGVAFELKDERKQPYFTRLLEPAPTDQWRTQAKYNACWYKTYTRVLDWGYFYRCCTSPFIPSVIQGLPKETDGIAVEGLTEDALIDFLGQVKPATACQMCAGHGANAIPWSEERDPVKWLEMSAR